MAASGANPDLMAAATAPTVLSRSGETVRPDPTAPVTTPPGATLPPPMASVVVVKKTIPVMWLGLAGAALLAIVVAAVMMLKGGSRPPAQPTEPSPTAVSEPCADSHAGWW